MFRHADAFSADWVSFLVSYFRSPIYDIGQEPGYREGEFNDFVHCLQVNMKWYSFRITRTDLTLTVG
jgi:hypothetical protein